MVGPLWCLVFPVEVCPEGKLTPEISRRYDLPVIFITIDELQEYLSAMPAALREEAVEKLTRLARRGPAAGFILNAASQRPDADSVPAETAGDHQLPVLHPGRRPHLLRHGAGQRQGRPRRGRLHPV
ncbi:MAG: hypothetical protein ACRDTA_22055 [Pseudonocardiaceae bacterium]